ncbi:MAG: PAS domain-containing protein, partial [Candidatus Liptonbacteria bacterium]|nr:PAS domain-containing protein [Candidatus Liptonbacteria bacterium]
MNTMLSLLGRRELRFGWVLFVLAVALSGAAIILAPPLFIAPVIGFAALAVGIVASSSVRLLRAVRRSVVDRTELDRLFVHSADGIIFYDANFSVERMNRAAEEIFGVAVAETAGTRITPEFARSPRFRLLAQIMFPSLASSSSIVSEADGAHIADVTTADPVGQFRVATIRVADESGATIGFMKILRETGRASSVTQMKNEFISVAAHNLRTPLNGLKWTMETLARDASLSDEGKDLARRGLAATDSMIGIVDDLLTAAQIEEGKYEYSFAAVDIGSFMKELTESFRPAIREAGLQLSYTAPTEALTVRADRSRLAIAFSNILDNAAKYNVQGGEITVLVGRSAQGTAAEIKREVDRIEQSHHWNPVRRLMDPNIATES